VKEAQTEAAWWDAHDDRERVRNAWGDPPYDVEAAANRLAWLLHDPSRRVRVLDLGCGPGRTAQFMWEHYDCDVVGVDSSPGMILAARRDFPGPTYLVSNGRDLPSGLTLHHAYSITMFEHIPHEATRSYLRQIHDALPIGGRLVFTHTPGIEPQGFLHHQCGDALTPFVWAADAGFTELVDIPPEPALDADPSWRWYAFERTA
jgi:SAM-dependent methyltransferase